MQYTGRYPVQASAMFLNELSISLSHSLSRFISISIVIAIVSLSVSEISYISTADISNIPVLFAGPRLSGAVSFNLSNII